MERHLLKDIREIDSLISQYIREDNIFVNHLNHTQIQILLYLIRHSEEEVCQKDLEIETRLKKASITGTLDSLEEKGVIHRIQSDDDKRKNIIVLSESTKEAKDRITSKIKELDETMRKDISDEDLNIFFDVIYKMKKNLEKR